MSLRRSSVLLASLFVCGACAPPSSIGALRAPIVGGTSDTADPGVVLVIAQQPNSQNASLCTGEVVSPHVVITAAHCVDPATVGSGAQFTVYTGDNVNNATSNADFLAVQTTDYDHAFNPSPQTLQNGHDIGVVILKSALSITPLPMNRTPVDNSMRGMPVRLVGYGITSGTDTTGMTAGIKRTTNTTLYQFDPLLLYFNDPNHLTCEGDSGGPAFMMLDGTTEVIVGITSFGDQGCTQGGADTRIDDYADAFVEPFIMQYDPPPPPDMSQPPVTFDDGGTVSFPPGSVGAACTDSSDCSSQICAKQGSGGFCTAACDPSVTDSCPLETHCGTIDTGHYCLRDRRGGGCSTTLGAADASTAVGFGLVLMLLGLGLIRRRVRQ
jgi:MYXO-CTERM domain-containing protein